MQSFIEPTLSESVLKLEELKVLRRKEYTEDTISGAVLAYFKPKFFEFRNAVFGNVFVLPRKIYNSFGKGITP